MKRIIALALAVLAFPAQAGTVTCTVAGSSIAQANQSRALSINDTDLQNVLNWVKSAQIQVIADQFNGGVVAGFNPTVPQIEWAWFQVSIVNTTVHETQFHSTTPAVVPPPINFQ